MVANLKAAKLDPNVWYWITESRVDKYGQGNFTSEFQRASDGSLGLLLPSEQHWQFQPVGNVAGRYALRCSATSVRQQLSVCYNPKEVADGRTQPCLADSNGSDEQKWDVASWGQDKMYRFINVKNGTDFYMDVHPGNPPFMSNNIHAKVSQPAQHWLMTSVDNVNDGAYSTVFKDVPKATSASARTTNTKVSNPPNSTSGSSSGNNNSSGGGLSSGAAAGIGVGVALGVIGLALALFFFWRRKRNSSRGQVPIEMSANETGFDRSPQSKALSSPYSSYQPSSVSPQAQQAFDAPAHNVIHEAPANNIASELDSTPIHGETNFPR